MQPKKADEMISLLRTLGVVIGVSETILGLFVLGMANRFFFFISCELVFFLDWIESILGNKNCSVGDLVANSTIARISPETAVAGKQKKILFSFYSRKLKLNFFFLAFVPSACYGSPLLSK